jgi:hypothetical protein
MVPHDRFTPHGYLDNPHHTRNLNPSGVVRSQRGIGFGWHFPLWPKGYGRGETYRAAMRLYLVDASGVRLELEDFPDLVATRHTKNEMTYAWSQDDLDLTATWFLVGEQAIACRAQVRSGRARRVALGVAVHYQRVLGVAGVWGESGLVGRLEDDAVVLQGFEDGDAFAVTVDRPGRAGAAAAFDPEFLRSPSLAGDHVVVTGERGDAVRLVGAQLVDVDLQAGVAQETTWLLARGRRRGLALDEARRARDRVGEALTQLRADDEGFWRGAPRLEGAWPDTWRRGFVTDLETLRMMVRAPIGIYRHAWDAMQIQAPRVVLAEAAIDALLLSYADLATAKDLLLGTFLDAPADNVPCSREDGSYNMVGANGSECGTAPEWGYPVRVAAHLFARDGDTAWLEAIYPGLERFLRWWEDERRDADGYFVYDNSWESGQDLSARFGPQKEGGGSTIRMVRPVDLQAAMADACAHMADFARVLGRDPAPWDERPRRYHTTTEAMWHDGGYRDHDARVGWSDVADVMQLAPVALGRAAPERVAALAPAIARLVDDAYLWPMFVWTATDAALVAEAPDVAVEIVRSTLDRAYGAWDRRSPGPDDPLPGVTCEYWGTDGRYGAEGYGWGAFGVHLLFRVLLGYRPLPDGFALRPFLPTSWPDGVYRVQNVNAGTGPVDVALDVRGDAIHVTVTARAGGLEVAGAHGREVRWTLARGEELTVRVTAAGWSA